TENYCIKIIVKVIVIVKELNVIFRQTLQFSAVVRMNSVGNSGLLDVDDLLPRRRSSQSQGQQQQQQEQQQQTPPTRGGLKGPDPPQNLHKFSFKSVDEQYVLLLDAIDKLKLGSEIDLPEIVVLGDQSEGKSTVLEAIAGVKLPKGDRTCTKCLVRLRIRKKPEVQATIEFDGTSTDVHDQADFSTTLKKIMDEHFPDQQVSMRAVIDIKISGPARPNLTVMDAPGFKSDMNENDENMTALREKLDNPNVVMVVVLKAINDIEASRGFGFASRLDPEFKRTVFVLTHCDNLTDNKQKMVTDMLNERHAFAVNCYSENSAYSSEKEKKFFNEQLFWRSQPQFNLGVDALISYLAEHMFRILEPRKEEIHSRVLKLWTAEDTELKKLTAEQEYAGREFKRFIRNVNKEIEEQLTGSHRSEKNELYSACRRQWQNFGEKINKVAESVINDLKKIVKDECEDQLGRETTKLPNYFPVKIRIVKKHIIDAVKPIIDQLIGEIECVIQSHIQDIVKEQLKNREPLENFVNDKVREYLPNLRRDVSKKIEMIVSMETIVYEYKSPRDEAQKQQEGAQGGEQEEQEETGLVESVVREGAEFFASPAMKPFVKPAFDKGKQLLKAITDDPADFLQKTLRRECRSYIRFVENRLANSIPKAIITFMLNQMAEDIWDCVDDDDIDEETKKQLKAEVEEKIENLKKSTEELQNLLLKF
ncbi:hypothetical protein BOX15_Mlig010126g3, partial [Macrostomum lignano]